VLVEVIRRDQQAGAGGQFWFDAPPHQAKAAKIVGAEWCDRGAATRSDDYQSFSLQAAQRFADRDEADPQLRGEIAQREHLPWS